MAGALPGAASASGPPPETTPAPGGEPFFLHLEGKIPVPGGAGSGSARITFILSDHPRKGRVIWSQGPLDVPVREGYFSATLGGGGRPLTADLFGGRRWLRLECEGCRGRTSFPVHRKGRAVAVTGLKRPGRPGPAAAKPLLRNLRLHQQRAYPTGIVPGGYIAAAYEAALSDPTAIPPAAPGSAQAAVLAEGTWTEIGPSTVTGGQTGGPVRGDVSGRVNSLALHPTDPDIAYACGAQGGVWKTTDGGGAWSPLAETLPSLATGAVALAASSPDVLYLGTGEANFSIDSYWGAGIFKSTDGGATFAPTADIDPNRAPMNSAAVAALAVHPSDPDLAVAAVGTFLEGNALFSGGIYRTTDGGASWSRVLGPGLPGGPVVGSDVVFDPSDSNVIYAALGWIGGSSTNGVWKSVDAGASFTKLDLGMSASDEANTGRVNIAVAPGNSQVLYASVQNVSSLALLGIWRSADGGATWTERTALGASCSTQCWYDMDLAVSPSDEDIVFFGGVNLYRSTNGGTSFLGVMNSSGSQGGIHVDQHALAFSPASPGTLWIGNDGGVWRTADATGSQPLNWINLNTNLALLQFQSVAVPPSDPDIAFGGTQDNGTNRYTGSSVWGHSADGDGGETLVDFVDPQVVYHTFFGVSIQRSETGGGFGSWTTRQTGLNTADRSLFYVPLEMDPGNSSVLYLGSYRLYRSVDQAGFWTAISGDLTVDPADPNNTGEISAIGVTAADPNVLYAGTSNAQIQVTSNLGGTWAHRTSPPLPDRYVTSIAVHPADASTAWASFSGFEDPATGDGHVFVTTDRGLTWTDTSANLPDIPVNDLVIDPVSPRMIYAATDIGPYVSTNAGASWRRYAGGFPNVATFELALQQPNVLFAATHGRGMFQALGCTAAGTTDLDADGVADFCDVCVGTANPLQEDGDADGFGPPCDCADADPARYPGAPEICNGLDDDCDGTADLGFAPPAEPGADLSIDQAGGLAWDAVTGAATYNLYRGGISPTGGFMYNQACLEPDIPATATSDPQDPSSDAAFFYLISAENCLSESGVGQATSGPRPLPSPCP